MENFIWNKNVLVLYPTDKQNLPIPLKKMKKYIKNVYPLNYNECILERGIKKTEEHIFRIVHDENIEVVIACLFSTDYYVSVEFFRELRSKARIVFLFGDDATFFDSHNKYYAQSADLVACSDSLVFYSFERFEIPVLLWPQIVDNNNLHPVKCRKEIDVSFVGDMRKRGRAEYVNFLKQNGIKVETFGINSEKGYVDSEKISEIFCKSRINLNFTQTGNVIDGEEMLNRIRQMNGRPIEISLTGSFCLSEYSPALKYFLNTESEIGVFYDKEDLLEKVKFYLSNPQVTEKMALKSYEKAAYYVSDSCFVEKLKKMEEILQRKKTINADKIYLDGSFKTDSVYSILCLSLSMLKRLKVKNFITSFLLSFKYGFYYFLRGLFKLAKKIIVFT